MALYNPRNYKYPGEYAYGSNFYNIFTQTLWTQDLGPPTLYQLSYSVIEYLVVSCADTFLQASTLHSFTLSKLSNNPISLVKNFFKPRQPSSLCGFYPIQQHLFDMSIQPQIFHLFYAGVHLIRNSGHPGNLIPPAHTPAKLRCTSLTLDRIPGSYLDPGLNIFIYEGEK